jgi:hypothetical protein
VNIIQRFFNWLNGPQLESVAIISHDGNEYHGELTWSDGKTIQVRGECTVWRQYPNGDRLPTCLESKLSDAVARYRWQFGRP